MLALRSLTLPPATETNAFLLGDEDLVLVDPGSDFPDELAALDGALAALEARGARLREVWITHHHPDHWASVPHLRARRALVVRAHERAAALIGGPAAADREFADGEVVSLGAAGRVAVVHTPGHTRGHVAFHVESAAALVAGDLVAGVGTVIVDPPDGDMAAYTDSLRRIGDLGLRAIWPAHGPMVADAEGKIREYVRHRGWREARILAAVGAGPTDLAAIVELAYDDIAPEMRPLGARSALAHLVKLAAEGRVVADGARWRRE